MPEFVVRRGSVQLAGQSDGEGAAVVLLHGLTATRRYVVMGSKALERAGHRVLAYDARGHGRSGPGDGYSYGALAADLEAVLDEQGIERAVLAGASMGAHTLLAFALAQPARVAGLVVITPAFDPVSSGANLARWDRLSDGLRSGGIDGFLAAYDLTAVPDRYRATIERVLRQRLALHAHPDAVADALAAVPRSRPFESWEQLGALAGVPAAVVASRDEADPEHPLATAERYARALGAELHVEQPGSSPLAWQGGQLSRVIAALAQRV